MWAGPDVRLPGPTRTGTWRKRGRETQRRGQTGVRGRGPEWDGTWT